MTRILMLLVVLLLLAAFAVACDAGGSVAPPSASRVSDPPAAVAAAPRPSEIPPSATTTPPASEPREPERPLAVHVAPRILAASWQAYLGRRVSLACRPVRRIDFTRTLVVADGARFLVMGPPSLTPCGPNTSTFTVMGSSTVGVAGRTVLPELLLEDGNGKDGAR